LIDNLGGAPAIPSGPDSGDSLDDWRNVGNLVSVVRVLAGVADAIGADLTGAKANAEDKSTARDPTMMVAMYVILICQLFG